MDNKNDYSFLAIAELFSFRKLFLQLGVLSTALFTVASYAAEVGSIPGSFEVSPSGAATYSIPIEVPPGINGLKPNLALVYNSQSGNGLLGQGWGLSGLSSITRCPKTLAQDGEIHGVDFTNADRLCLDGQRLLLKNGSNNDADYWADGAEYRTEIETFSKVTKMPGEWFQVESKEGRIAEYGNTIDSALNVTVIATQATPVLSWAINKSSDQSGNSISCIYSEDIVNGELLLNRIEYGGIDSYLIELKYEPRTDVFPLYSAGVEFNQNSILKDINIYSSVSNITPFKTYKVIYSLSDSGESIVESFSLCSENSCLPTTTLNWKPNQTTYGWEQYSNVAGFGNLPKSNDAWKFSGDFNGDGRTDIGFWYGINGDVRVAFSEGDRFVWRQMSVATFGNMPASNDAWKFSGDFNGDGRTDIGFWYGINGDVRVAFSEGDRFVWRQMSVATFGNMPASNDAWKFSGDFNGDGRTDIGFWYGINGDVRVAFSEGDRFVWRQMSVATFGNMPASNDAWKFSGDFNGDGRTDIGFWYGINGDVRVAFSEGDRFVWRQMSVATFGNMPASNDAWKFSGDFNGDGRTDIGFWYGINGDIRVGFSDGIKFHWKQMSNASGFGNLPASNDAWKFTGDFNSDGIQDIGFWWGINGDIRAAVSNGDSFQWKQINVASGFGNIPASIDVWKFSGDFSGDGASSIGFWWGINGDVRVLDSTHVPLVVENLDKGDGSTIGLSYIKPTTNNDVIDFTNFTYPEQEVKFPGNVVSAVSTENGFGGQHTVTYKYGGLKIHKQGRGSLGFRVFEVTDEQTGITNKTEFHQDYPFVGAVKHSESRLANGQLLSESDSYYTFNGTTCVNYPVTDWTLPECAVGHIPGIVLPYPGEATSTQYDLNGAHIKSERAVTTHNNFIDNFVGSTTSTETTQDSVGNVYEQETTYTYGNNVSSKYSEKAQLTKTQIHSIDRGVFSPTITKTFSYNINGLLEVETLEPNTTNESISTYGYDGFGNRTSVIVSGDDIVTRTTSTIFDANGQFPEKIINAHGHTELRTYDLKFGVIKTRTGPNGLTTTYEYDSFGRQTAVITATGNRTEVMREWCSVDCLIPAIEPIHTLPQTASYTITTFKKGSNLVEYAPYVKVYYDKFDREIRRETLGFDGTVIYADTNYDTQGRLAAQTLPYFDFETSATYATRFEYDVLGRVEHQYDPVGTHNQILRNGLVTTYSTEVQNPYRLETRIEVRDAIGRLLSVQDNANQAHNYGYSYTTQGKRTTTTDPVGNVVAVEYDKFGRKIVMDDPDMGHWEYGYNVLGELTSQKDAKNQITSMQYDLLGRMTRRNDHDGLISEWIYKDNLKAGDVPRNKAIGKLGHGDQH